jgi:hypothetical protein
MALGQIYIYFRLYRDIPSRQISRLALVLSTKYLSLRQPPSDMIFYRSALPVTAINPGEIVASNTPRKNRDVANIAKECETDVSMMVADQRMVLTESQVSQRTAYRNEMN